MKKLFLTLALAAFGTLAYGQGSIAFLSPPTVRHQLVQSDGTSANAPLGIALNYGIFVGTSASSLSENPAGPLATPSTTAAGGMGGVPAVYVLDGHAPGAVVFAQVRAWDSAFGANWQAAMTQGRWYGQSDVRELEPLGPTAGPGTVIWQGATGTDVNRFFALRINIVPEPSTIALGVLGLGSLLLFRRRQAK
jgi:hypothetical protein